MPTPQRPTRIALIVVIFLILVLYLRIPATNAGAGAGADVADSACKVVSAGSSGHVLLKGTLLTRKGAVPDGCILIKAGKIARVGHSREECQNEHDATIVECRGSVISPGFINTHEHLDYATVGPLHSEGQLYKQRHDWRVGLRGYPKQTVLVTASELDASKWGELRHIFSGTTSIVGGHMAPGLARNLDFANGLEDYLDSPAANNSVFPLDDSKGIQRNGDCDYGPFAIDLDHAHKLHRYVGHVAEGVDEIAANEFQCLSNKDFDTTPLPGGGGLSTDIISPNMVLVHALGLSKADFRLVAKREAKVVWSPRSNVFLYGKTLDISYLLEAGITVALGTDWLPSGSATMAREAECALSATKISYGHDLKSETLWEMMTINAAKVAGFEDYLGSIDEGKLADIVVFAGNSPNDPYGQAVYARQENIELVMRGGKVLVASSTLSGLTNGLCETLRFGMVRKLVCVEDELKSTFAALQASLDKAYPAILPGVPPDEPSCKPSQ